MSSIAFLACAGIAIWLVFGGYLLFIGLTQTKLERALKELENEDNGR